MLLGSGKRKYSTLELLVREKSFVKRRLINLDWGYVNRVRLALILLP